MKKETSKAEWVPQANWQTVVSLGLVLLVFAAVFGIAISRNSGEQEQRATEGSGLTDEQIAAQRGR